MSSNYERRFNYIFPAYNIFHALKVLHELRCLKNRYHSSHTGKLSAFHIRLWGKSPEVQSVSSTAYGKRPALSTTIRSRMDENVLAGARVSCSRCFHLIHSAAFLYEIPSVKARVCEDTSMLVARWYTRADKLFVAHRHSYAIV
ncbi:hypothetical protein CVT25_008164 [Psilocybe cyanescens]|uniref:Uncharacterized protein n=1 Tax=Psilocybe cyanescens TaxID=93625 RepID=A0A409XGB0_PSICY|nr:hypothetical protein CVT25_008164 [Psilocybe cyanescens]